MTGDRLRIDRFLKERGRPKRAVDTAREVIVFGGKGGVGTSVVVTALACAATQDGYEVLLIENVEALATLHDHLGIERGLGVSALRGGVYTPADLAVEVTRGLRLISSDRGDGDALPVQSSIERHFLQTRLRSLYSEVDLVLVDGGSTVSSLGSIASSNPALFIGVTDPTRISVSSTYALIKALLRFAPKASVALLVNRVTPEEAEIVHRELAASVENFLGIKLGMVGSLPEAQVISDSARRGPPLIEAIQDSDAVVAVSEICMNIMRRVSPDLPLAESTALPFPKRG